MRFISTGLMLAKVPTKNGTVQGALVDGCRSQDEIASAAWSKCWPQIRTAASCSSWFYLQSLSSSSVMKFQQYLLRRHVATETRSETMHTHVICCNWVALLESCKRVITCACHVT